jgi:rRNA-processing protein FCF1
LIAGTAAAVMGSGGPREHAFAGERFSCLVGARTTYHADARADTQRVPPVQESNVRIPACAWDALEKIKVARGVSRDEAVRQLVEEHVVAQEGRAPDERLTHISTVLRYPPPPRLTTDRDLARRLRVRLSSAVVVRAREVPSVSRSREARS